MKQIFEVFYTSPRTIKKTRLDDNLSINNWNDMLEKIRRGIADHNQDKHTYSYQRDGESGGLNAGEYEDGRVDYDLTVPDNPISHNGNSLVFFRKKEGNDHKAYRYLLEDDFSSMQNPPFDVEVIIINQLL